MVTRSAADTNAVKAFDAEAFILGFQIPEIKVPLFRRGDLMPRINELDALIEAAEAAEKSPDRSFSDGQPSAARLITEQNQLKDELEASKVVFTFRPFTDAESKKYNARVVELMKDDTESEVSLYAEGMAMSCTSVSLSVDQWRQLCDRVRVPSFLAFGRRWVELLATNGAPEVPFSRKPLPGPATPPSSGG